VSATSLSDLLGREAGDSSALMHLKQWRYASCTLARPSFTRASRYSARLDPRHHTLFDALAPVQRARGPLDLLCTLRYRRDFVQLFVRPLSG
jgi:hypothetical protein